jgi:hypothetical protein
VPYSKEKAASLGGFFVRVQPETDNPARVSLACFTAMLSET